MQRSRAAQCTVPASSCKQHFRAKHQALQLHSRTHTPCWHCTSSGMLCGVGLPARIAPKPCHLCQAVVGSMAHISNNATPHMAVRTGNLDILQAMLKKGSDIDTPNKHGATPLSIAVDKAQISCAALECARDQHPNHAHALAEANLEDAGEDYESCIEILNLLLDHGADPDAIFVPIDGQNRHTFKYKPRKLLHQAVTCGDATTTGLLLQYGADVDAQDHNGSTPLHLAALHNKVAAARVLLSHGAFVSASDHSNTTPLHSAAGADAVALAGLLLVAGADKHAENQAGDTPLHAAAQHAGADMIELLLAENCNPLVENLLEKVPYDLANRAGNSAVRALLVEACIERQIALRQHSVLHQTPMKS